jgi:hypothetical protein
MTRQRRRRTCDSRPPSCCPLRLLWGLPSKRAPRVTRDYAGPSARHTGTAPHDPILSPVTSTQDLGPRRWINIYGDSVHPPSRRRRIAFPKRQSDTAVAWQNFPVKPRAAVC